MGTLEREGPRQHPDPKAAAQAAGGDRRPERAERATEQGRRAEDGQNGEADEGGGGPSVADSGLLV